MQTIYLKLFNNLSVISFKSLLLLIFESNNNDFFPWGSIKSDSRIKSSKIILFEYIKALINRNSLEFDFANRYFNISISLILFFEISNTSLDE